LLALQTSDSVVRVTMILRRRASRPRPKGALLAAAAALGAAVPGGGCAQIAGLSDHQLYPVVQVAAGADHACVLMHSGDVWCWGANDTGQLGHRTTNGGADCTTQCPAALVATLPAAAQISAGLGFTCATLVDGHVACCGKNQTGELGRSTGTMQCGAMPCDPVPAPVVGVSNAVQVSAGAGYACARISDGSVWCWGDNGYGQLGTGTVAPGPVAAAPAKGIASALDVSTSLVGDNTCAVRKDGTVWCWGRNEFGGIGRPPATSDPMCTTMMQPCSPDPSPVGGISGAVTVHAGCFGGCAGLAGGAFSCWGNDGIGCLGTKPQVTDTNLAPAPVVAAAGLTMLDLRSTTTCGADGAGKAWCWGQYGYGALGAMEKGLAPEMCSQASCLHTGQDVGLAGVTQIAAGGVLGVALESNGTVWAWGLNQSGQLGHPPGTLKDAKCQADMKSWCNGVPARVQTLPP
jgi:alpha-tubulin suppressor-like RCC1 family protein